MGRPVVAPGKVRDPLQPHRVRLGVSHEVVLRELRSRGRRRRVQARPGPGMSAERIELMENLIAGRSESRRVDVR